MLFQDTFITVAGENIFILNTKRDVWASICLRILASTPCRCGRAATSCPLGTSFLTWWEVGASLWSLPPVTTGLGTFVGRPFFSRNLSIFDHFFLFSYSVPFLSILRLSAKKKNSQICCFYLGFTLLIGIFAM